MNYVEEVIAAVLEKEPISPWELHRYCESWGKPEGAENVRQALRALMQAGWVKMDEEGMLGSTSGMPDRPGDEAPSSSLDVVDLDLSSGRPTSGRVIPLSLPPSPTDPPTFESHQGEQTENRTRALYYAIQREAESLLRLEDALSTYLQGVYHRGDGKVRRVASALLHKALSVRREYVTSDKWIRETLLGRKDG